MNDDKFYYTDFILLHKNASRNNTVAVSTMAEPEIWQQQNGLPSRLQMLYLLIMMGMMTVFPLHNSHSQILFVQSNDNSKGFHESLCGNNISSPANCDHLTRQQHRLVTIHCFLNIMGGHNHRGTPAQFISDDLLVDFPGSSVQPGSGFVQDQ